VVRSDGTLVRDYLYIEDGALAYLQLAQAVHERPELAGEAFNFSNEVQLTVREMVDRITTLMQSTLAPDIQNVASHEIRHQWLSAAKARDVLGWYPRFTVDEALLRTIAWYQEHLRV
jgi:CDP-glucose 4,6-dehydratase